MQSGMEHAIWKSLILPGLSCLFLMLIRVWFPLQPTANHPSAEFKYGGFRTWIMYKYNTSKLKHLKPRQTGVVPFNPFHQTSNSKLDNRLHSDSRTSRTVTDESRDPRPLAVPSFHIFGLVGQRYSEIHMLHVLQQIPSSFTPFMERLVHRFWRHHTP